MDFFIGDRVSMKKPHPCGGYEWEVLRVGMDFRIRCVQCAHTVMLPRKKFEKSVKKTISPPCTGQDSKQSGIETQGSSTPDKTGQDPAEA